MKKELFIFLLIIAAGVYLFWSIFESPIPLELDCFSYTGDIYVDINIPNTRDAKSNKAIYGLLNIYNYKDNVKFFSDIKNPSIFYRTDLLLYKDTFTIISNNQAVTVSNDKRIALYNTTPLKCFELSILQGGIFPKLFGLYK